MSHYDYYFEPLVRGDRVREVDIDGDPDPSWRGVIVDLLPGRLARVEYLDAANAPWRVDVPTRLLAKVE